MSLNIGVFAIGSLFWDANEIRAAWRKDRLEIDATQIVTAPIRYGRRSQSRNNTFTMVFSRSSPLGQARIIPLKSSIGTIDDLVVEAEFLWRAEQPSASAHSIGARWGCVALLCNPDRNIAQTLIDGWAERVKGEAAYGPIAQTQAEGTLVSPKDGMLRIDWPHSVDSGVPADFDILLSTPTSPTLDASSDYPSVNSIADAWNCSGANAQYYWKNRANGIYTFQDREIEELLDPQIEYEVS